jgi:hypothetical protein
LAAAWNHFFFLILAAGYFQGFRELNPKVLKIFRAPFRIRFPKGWGLFGGRVYFKRMLSLWDSIMGIGFFGLKVFLFL